MKDLRSDLCTKRLYFDGGFGTVLQGMGLKSGEAPETWNITHPDEVTGVHRAYIEAGSNIITTNTFGVNRDKYENYAELISAALDCAENAVGGSEAYIALDIGPTGGCSSRSAIFRLRRRSRFLRQTCAPPPTVPIS